MIRLDSRLDTILSWVPKGSRIADIGTDHAYLPAAGLERGILRGAIAADIHEGPLQMARQTVKNAGYTAEIECRLSDGLEKIAPGETDGAAICGMGGSLIAQILEAQPETVRAMQFLLLQPMTHAGTLRKWLAAHGWEIKDEALIEDGKFLYELIYAVPGKEAYPLSWLDAEIGPVNRKRGGMLTAKHAERCIDKRQHILRGLEKGGQKGSAAYLQIAEEIKELEAMI